MNLNTQFVFEKRTKTLLIGGMVLGALCLGLTFFNDDEYHTRFWTNWLHNSVYFTGIAFMSMFFLSAQITAFAGWNSVIKRVWEASSQFMWVGLILIAVIVLGVWGHFHHLYLWNDPNINVSDPHGPHYDKVLAGKKGFLNPVWFTVGSLGFLAIWYWWAKNLRQASVDQDTMETADFRYYKKQRKWAASFLPLGGFLSTVFLWQLMMSIDPHWYSTMFAWYSMVSMWLGSLSMTVMLLIALKWKGYLEHVNYSHLHDVGKFLFGISVFWTYLWFDQFMLIWYANNGEETTYFFERMHHYPVLFWGNLLMNFVTPFFILMRNDTKRKAGTMFFVAVIVFFGHWWDYFYMIKPGARIAAHEATELREGKNGMESKSGLAPTKNPGHEEETATAEKAHGEEPAPGTVKDVEPGDEAAQQAGPTAHTPPVSSNEKSAITNKVDSTGAQHTEAATETEEKTAGAVEESAGKAHHESAEAEEHDETKSFKLGYTVPGLEEIGIMIGFLSLFLFFFFTQLTKASLVPLKDPYLEESLHHDTGALIESEGASAHH